MPEGMICLPRLNIFNHNIQARQQEARAKKLKDHEELEALMQAEVKEKEKEIKAGMEREKIARELRKVGKYSFIRLHYCNS